MNKTIYSTIAAVGLAVGSNAEQVKFAQLPAAVQKTVNRNLNGGMVQEIDRKTENGRTIYDVEVRREGRNNRICVDADGKLVARNDSVGGSASVDVDVDRSDRGVFDKNDGTILGVVDNPKKEDFEAEARVGDDGVKVETNVEKPRDRGVTEEIFDKNDGKILDVVPAPRKNKVEADIDVDKKVDVDINRDRGLDAEVKIDTDDNSKVRVESNEGKGKGIFRKGDGKILGIPIPGRNRAEHEVSVDTNRRKVTTDGDGGLDTDKNDGRIVGVPKRGFETLSMNELPPVVRETIRREAGGYKVAEIERATLDGRMVYEVDIQREGANRELHIAADGNILKDSDREAVGSPAAQERGRGAQK
jgi:uncharacterized membrane protein YkoI